MPHISDRPMLVRDGLFKFMVKTDEDEEDIEEIFSLSGNKKTGGRVFWQRKKRANRVVSLLWNVRLRKSRIFRSKQPQRELFFAVD